MLEKCFTIFIPYKSYDFVDYANIDLIRMLLCEIGVTLYSILLNN